MFEGGVDEAGRGPVLGPMVMAIVVADQKGRDFLNKIGVKDSKLLTPVKRTKLARIIKENFAHVIIKSNPEEIDKSLRREKDSLNVLEARTTAKLINRVHKKMPFLAFQKNKFEKVIVDLPSKNKEEYNSQITKKLNKELVGKIILQSEFKADLNHVIVAAASILAKTTRDGVMKMMSKKLNINLGSGYPSDHVSIKALNEHYEKLKEIKFVRNEWKTTKEMLAKREQTTLGNF